MRLDPECVRDLLLTLESESKYGEDRILEEIDLEQMLLFPRMKNYKDTSVLYAAQKLHEAGYIVFSTLYADDQLDIASFGAISFAGHQFLENIRSDANWRKIKDVSKKVGSMSVNVLAQIATGLITSLVNTHLGIHQ